MQPVSQTEVFNIINYDNHKLIDINKRELLAKRV